MSIIALLTDFGVEDEYVGVMKGAILGIAPATSIIDLRHTISPQSIQQASLLLLRAYRYFPKKTIFCCVVDPGVGTTRKPIAARGAEWFFVGPDNGLFSPVFDEVESSHLSLELVILDRPQFWLPEVGQSFHGRDIFAPVAAHLSNNHLLEELGTPIQTYVHLNIPQPRRTNEGWEAEIIHIDHFGNCATNLTNDHLKSLKKPRVVIKGKKINKLSITFGEAQPGELIAMLDSSGHLSICSVNSSAESILNAHAGDPLILEEQ